MSPSFLSTFGRVGLAAVLSTGCLAAAKWLSQIQEEHLDEALHAQF